MRPGDATKAMAHLLRRLGAVALQPRRVGEKLLPPLLSREDAMKLREQFYRDGQPWPYEDIVPGRPQPPAGADDYLQRRQDKEQRRAARQKEIADAMAKMPKLIAEYRAMFKLNWDDVSAVDKLTMTQAQIKDKYIRRRLARQAGV